LSSLSPASEPLFLVKNLSVIFPDAIGGGKNDVSGGSGHNSGFSALSGINLAVNEGECLILAGSNGSGKTLLMRCLAALAVYQKGEIFYRGVPLEKAVKTLRSELGLIFQDADSQIVGETIEEDIAFGPSNLGFPKDEIKRRVTAAIEDFGLAEKTAVPPRSLSGGEKRRLAAAGIAAMGCSAVIMDEPFANLDYPGVVQTLRLIQKLKETGKTLIILTHELEKVLAFGTRLIILHEGRIKDDGKPAEVLGRLDTIWGVRDPRHNYSGIEDCSWLEN
jgi:biotin transport system ATP-binding protein